MPPAPAGGRGGGFAVEPAFAAGRLRADAPMLVVTMPGQNTDTAMLLSASSKRQCLHHPDDTELRCRIHACATVTEQARKRRRGDHRPALTVRLNARQERVNGVEDAVEIDAHAPVPIVVACLADAADDGDARIRHDGVYFAEPLHDIVCGGVERRAIRHVHTDGMHAIRSLIEVFHGLVEVRPGAVADRHLHARIQERARDTETDAAVAAGDEGHFAFHVLHRRRDRRRTAAGSRRIGSQGRQPAHHHGGRGARRGQRSTPDELTAGAPGSGQRALLRVVLVRHVLPLPRVACITPFASVPQPTQLP